MTRTIKVALCLPWYAGPHPDCVSMFLTFQHYLGRLQERMWWLSQNRPHDEMPPLDGWGDAEIPASLVGTRIEFIICTLIGYSLPGIARGLAVEKALELGADYLFFYDDDMLFTPSVFLQLLAHDVPVVGALAFTSRLPITPVIYRFSDSGNGKLKSEAVLDYKRNQLQQVDAIGFGVVLIQASVFRKILKPWFANPGAGEDIQFCGLCKKWGIPVYVDTSAKTAHIPRYAPELHDEEKFLKDRAADLEKQ